MAAAPTPIRKAMAQEAGKAATTAQAEEAMPPKVAADNAKTPLVLHNRIMALLVSVMATLYCTNLLLPAAVAAAIRATQILMIMKAPQAPQEVALSI